MNERAIIIGSSTTGKTTLLNYLREHTDTPVGESDDALKEMNGGIYPDNSEFKINVLAPKMVADVLAKDRIIFFSNTHYFKHEDLELAHSKGFIIMQLQLAREHMLTRNQKRVLDDGYSDLSRYFDSMHTYQQELHEKGLVDVVVNTDKAIDKVAAEILSHLF